MKRKKLEQDNGNEMCQGNMIYNFSKWSVQALLNRLPLGTDLEQVKVLAI